MTPMKELVAYSFLMIFFLVVSFVYVTSPRKMDASSPERGVASVKEVQEKSYVLVVQHGSKETRFEALYENGAPVLRRMEKPGFGRELKIGKKYYNQLVSRFRSMKSRKFNYSSCPRSWISAVTFVGEKPSKASGFCLKEKSRAKKNIVDMANKLSKKTRQ